MGVEKTNYEERTVDAVDVIIPAYRERPDALHATLKACLTQTYRVSRILLIDDGSPEPVSLPSAISDGQVDLLRLPSNQGISTARNAGIQRANAPFLACVNIEVLPSTNWVETCLVYLSRHPRVGACYTRILPDRPKRLLTRWRMRFHEQKYGQTSGAVSFAPGHAVMFRRDAVESVGGYDARFRHINEDFDICDRMRRAGWETHFVAQSECVSIQCDTLSSLSNKQLLRSDWQSPSDYSLLKVFVDQGKWLFVRLARNVAKGRIHFAPVDVAITAGALGIATARAIGSRRELQKVAQSL
jgi:GT2 family glycosyltransferase